MGWLRDLKKQATAVQKAVKADKPLNRAARSKIKRTGRKILKKAILGAL